MLFNYPTTILCLLFTFIPFLNLAAANDECFYLRLWGWTDPEADPPATYIEGKVDVDGRQCLYQASISTGSVWSNAPCIVDTTVIGELDVTSTNAPFSATYSPGIYITTTIGGVPIPTFSPTAPAITPAAWGHKTQTNTAHPTATIMFMATQSCS